MSEYTEPQKMAAREAVISAAIESLTSNRIQSTLARKSYVREVRDYFVRANDDYDAPTAKLLSDETIERWESFYDSIILDKKPSNLKVAYLSGPNPENDLEVLCSHGVLPENIWAFESDNATYLKAVSSALESKFPFIKIVNSGIDSFIDASHQRFDIIYLDFCGPLPSRNQKQRTLSTITKILAKHALNSPGALITNLSLPDKTQDKQGYSLMSNLVATYLYPKSFIETGDAEHNMTEGPISEYDDYESWHNEVSQDLENYYGQFITRVMMDHTTLISPYDRFPKESPLFKKLFDYSKYAEAKNESEKMLHFYADPLELQHESAQSDSNSDEPESDEDSDSDYTNPTKGGDIIVDAEMYPLLWSFVALSKSYNNRDDNFPQEIFSDPAYCAFADLFLSQLNINFRGNDLVEKVAALAVYLSERNSNYLSDSLRTLKASHDFRKYHQFCDLFLFHQVLELLLRQFSTPYHVNVEKTLRWKYKAKDTKMFMDLLIVDECRYLYDWMPTADMFESGITNIERQLSFRFALDAIRKHSRWYNPEMLFGTGIVNQDTVPFEAKILLPRIAID